jgi:hypothetical protein
MFKILVHIVVEKIYIKCNNWRVAAPLSYIYDVRFLKVKPTSLGKHDTYTNRMEVTLQALRNFILSSRVETAEMTD